jgi:hypothetical protein
MQLLAKAILGLAFLMISLAVAPAVKADPIVIQTGGFSLTNLGNDGSVPNGLDTLSSAASSASHNFDRPGTFVTALNELTFEMGFTGVNSPGSYDFSFSQLVTIDGQTQVLNMFGRIDIGIVTDTVHILSSDPLSFTFGTFTVDANVLPMAISGTNNGVFCDVLKARMIVRNSCAPVPEPATLTLLGLGIAGAAAKVRQRRKRSRSAEG